MKVLNMTAFRAVYSKITLSFKGIASCRLRIRKNGCMQSEGNMMTVEVHYHSRQIVSLPEIIKKIMKSEIYIDTKRRLLYHWHKNVPEYSKRTESEIQTE